jgi:hypothetical protein
MKPRHRILILVLLAGVFGGCAVPPVDAPETNFDESDAPVNLAPPSQDTVRFVRPVTDPLVIPGLRFYRAECNLRGQTLEGAAMSGHRHPHALQDLSCALLI